MELSLLRLENDPKIINDLLNDPTIYPWVSGGIEATVDATEYMASVQTVLLGAKTGSGAFWFIPRENNTYEVHSQFKPNSKDVLAMAREAARYMFNVVKCAAITTMVPQNNRPALNLTKRMKFKFVKTDGQFKTPLGTCLLNYYILLPDTWKE